MHRRAFLSFVLLAALASSAAAATARIEDGATLVGLRKMKNWGSVSTPLGFFQTVEQCFAKGAVPLGNLAEPRKGDGTTAMLNWQADNRITWDDGSLRCARFTFKYPSALAASGTDTLKFYSRAGSWNNAPWATATTIISAQDFRLEATIGGTTFTCGVNNEISRGNTYQFDAGPTAVGLVVHGVYRSGITGSSTDQGSLQCRIYVVAYENGDFKVWARTDCSRASNTTANQFAITSAALKNYALGSPTLWSFGALTCYGGTFFVAADTDGQPYYSGTDVRKVVDAFPSPVLSNPETTNLWDARIIPFYHLTAGAIAAINPTPKPITYKPMEMGDYTGVFYDAGGGSPWIGPMTFASAAAMWRGDWPSLRQDTIDALAEGAQQWHFRDSINGNLINLNGAATYANMTQNAAIAWGNGATITIPNYGGSGSPFRASQTYSSSHIPAFYQFQLMYSGEEWWLDAQHDEAEGINGSVNPGNACYQRNPLINSQWYATGGQGLTGAFRGFAWFEREADNSAWMTPIGHPLYQYLQDVIAQHWGAFADFYTPPGNRSTCPDYTSAQITSWATLGLSPDTYGAGPGELTAPWMHDFFGIEASLAVLRGQVSPTNYMIAKHLTNFVVGRSANGCAYSAAAYNLNIAVGNSPTAPPWAESWSDVYAGITIGNDTIKGGPLVNANGTGCPTNGLNTNTTNGWQNFGVGNYPNILLGAAIMAKLANITGAVWVVTRYTAERKNAGCCSDSDLAANPQWAIAEPQ